ncbi:T9SS type A sorting domain-containing protein [Hymenobacter siberiensis]|uniref:T9SS type A sorting domain-containing protein n=1 Tax=Hymenobacter siberiensis TaxID=2848396 RepID=UPI001C1E22A2|nr:T9SS type A sorting domain-containing protein [Hymenobacter siberiensis]MBU6123133.1 T9SS type A sorting domain-containing protein [Hymenobacter siberiensis]
MKKSTLKFGFLLAFLFSATVSMAQTITTLGIIGSATANGWTASTSMTHLTTSNGHDWSITLPLTGSGAVKFRTNDDWAVNWGGTGLSGTGTQGGADIVITNSGNYTARINDATGVYSIVLATATATQSASAAILKMAVSPNPASGTASVSYELPATATAAITVQNLMGQSVRQFSAVRQNAGLQSQSLPLQNLASGIYLVKLETGTLTQTTRLVVE